MSKYAQYYTLHSTPTQLRRRLELPRQSNRRANAAGVMRDGDEPNLRLRTHMHLLPVAKRSGFAARAWLPQFKMANDLIKQTEERTPAVSYP
ncbi:hypothetical protein AWB64_02304 [Caballeronia sordidicola]|uniref:Uncharacterized protein n=1 Tax=Caballeronia sordidicola TaxID=196367 RepID=A0A158G773_CABSO|nr:hypothetical protein AWB64_02304 [Caballeronia sordidicola]